jgi:hypothetical protein
MESAFLLLGPEVQVKPCNQSTRVERLGHREDMLWWGPNHAATLYTSTLSWQRETRDHPTSSLVSLSLPPWRVGGLCVQHTVPAAVLHRPTGACTAPNTI